MIPESERIIKYILNPDYRFIIDSNRGKYDDLSDIEYIKRKFKAKLGYPLNLDDPKTFNEKLQWLKLNDRRPLYTRLVDKYAVKDYVAEKLGEQYIIPTLGVWENVDEIDFDALPDRYVLKCTHDSGGLVVCRDKKTLNIENAKARLKRCLERDYYCRYREWPYRNVPHRIIAEKYMEDETGSLRDYKIFCFNGKPRFFKIDFDRYTAHRANYYDTNLQLLPFGEAHYPPDPNRNLVIPDEMPEMLEKAEILARDTTFSRIDFYDVDHNVYFGEITFYPASGMGPFTPPEWDRKIGDMLSLE